MVLRVLRLLYAVTGTIHTMYTLEYEDDKTRHVHIRRRYDTIINCANKVTPEALAGSIRDFSLGALVSLPVTCDC